VCGVSVLEAGKVDAVSNFHEPVLLEEVLSFLVPSTGGVFFDGTIGGGGHARAILESSVPDGRLLGFDLDEEAIRRCSKALDGYGDRIRLVRDDYSNLEEYLGGEKIDGAILDLGVSSYQIDHPEKGFSYEVQAPLDMRFDRRGRLRAATILNTFSEKELSKIFLEYGEERHARRIARAIVREREIEPFKDSLRLSELVAATVPGPHGRKSVARIFQALRIAVNGELETLTRGLEACFRSLARGGRLVVISYHSLEDRIVKRYFRFLEADCVCPPDFPVCRCGKVRMAEILTPAPVRPSREELSRNPRSRSARLRAIKKTADFH